MPPLMLKVAADGSGTLGREELPVPPPPERFARMDRNGDGALDEAELRGLVRLVDLAMRSDTTESAGPVRDAVARWFIQRQLKDL